MPDTKPSDPGPGLVPAPAGDGQTPAGDGPARLAASYRSAVDGRVSRLPLPGAGATQERFEALADLAAEDLSLARLCEGHADALAILAEAGRGGRHAGCAYGVWAARSRAATLRATPHGRGWQLDGIKEFGSGARLNDRALVTAEAPDGYRLFDVDLTGAGTAVVDGSWAAVGMAGSDSATTTFERVTVAPDDVIGEPGFYLGRPGFFFGAVGVAACWYGGARALVDRLLAGLGPDPSEHVLSETGRAVAALRAVGEVLAAAAAEIDADPLDAHGGARYRALWVRETAHTACVAVLSGVAQAGGARPLGHDEVQSRRAADLYVFLTQHHGGPDAAELGRVALAGDPWG